MTDFTQVLHKQGLKITPIRIGVLDILSSQTSPSGIADILDALVIKKISADQATVYRIIEKLIEKKVVKAVNFEEGRLRYELADDHHHHLVCVNCKRIESIEECSLDELGQQIKQTHRFEVQKHNLEFFGVCANCK